MNPELHEVVDLVCYRNTSIAAFDEYNHTFTNRSSPSVMVSELLVASMITCTIDIAFITVCINTYDTDIIRMAMLVDILR